MASTVPRSIFDAIEEKIRAASQDEGIGDLWAEIRAAFDEGGHSAVKSVIDDRVKQSKDAAKKDLKVTRFVAGDTAPKKRASPAKKAAPRKRTAAK
jgi:hypothetical protein